MPTPLVDFSGPIIQAYMAGRNERLQREQFQAQRAEKQQQFELAEKQMEAEQKKFEAQLKATTEYHKATLGQQQAQLDLATAAQKANSELAKSKLKADWLRDYAQELNQAPQVSNPEYDPTYGGSGEELDPFTSQINALMTVPQSEFDIGPGITVNREELPRRYGREQQDLANLERSQAAQAAMENRLNISEIARNERARLDKLSDAELQDKRLAAQAALAEAKEEAKRPKSYTPAEVANDPEVGQFVRGNRPAPPPGSKKWDELNAKFAVVPWPKYNALHPEAESFGFSPHSPAQEKELRNQTTARSAIKFAFEYAQALDDWNTGRNREKYAKMGTTAFGEVVKFARIAPSFLPGLKGDANLGVLGKSDLALLASNLPDITGAITERAFRVKLAESNKGQSWGMQRAIGLARRYAENIDRLIGPVPAGQRHFEITEKYGLLPDLAPEHNALLGRK